MSGGGITLNGGPSFTNGGPWMGNQPQHTPATMPSPPQPGLYCTACKHFLAHIEDLALELEGGGARLMIHPKKVVTDTIRREICDDGDPHVTKIMFCGKCTSKVGKTIRSFATEVDCLGGDKAYFQCGNGEHLSGKKWSALKDRLMEEGILCLNSKEVARQAGCKLPSREGMEIHPTIYVNMDSAMHQLKDLTNTPMRPYQVEMVNRALRQNCLVCLPTGAGKTLVAAAVVHAMLRLNPQKICAFVVDKNHLVEQQAQYLENEVPGLRIVKLAGQMEDTDLRKNKKLLSKFRVDVLVLTCKLLNNLINLVSVRIEDFCLLVIDEAHNAKGGHPYFELMKECYDKSINPVNRPLVLCLTASPVENPGSNLGVDAGLRDLQKNLHCYPIYPVEHDPYANGISRTKDYVKAPDMSAQEKELCHMLNGYIVQVLSHAKGWLAESCQEAWVQNFMELQNAAVFDASQTLDTNKFRGALRKLHEALLPGRGQRYADRGLALIDHFNNILAVLDLNHVIGWAPAMSGLKGMLLDVLDARTGHEKRKREVLTLPNKKDFVFRDLLKKAESENVKDILTEHKLSARCKLLLTILRTHIKERGAEARALVFVDMRRTARKLGACLSKMEDIYYALNPKVVVGQGLNGDGLSLHEQQSLLSDFRKGQTKLLIATTVLEEGLDVPSCSLVVRFVAPNSLKAFVQSRGRACRSDDAAFVVIASSEEEERKQHVLSALCTEVTKTLVKMTQAQDPNLSNLTEGAVVGDLDLQSDFIRADYNATQNAQADDEGESPSVDTSEEDDADLQEFLETLYVSEQDIVNESSTYLDEYDMAEVVLDVKMVITDPDMQHRHQNVESRFRSIFSYGGALVDWSDIFLPEESIYTLNSRRYAHCRLFPHVEDALEYLEYEKQMLEYVMDGEFGKGFWLKLNRPVPYMAGSERLEVHSLEIGSWLTHHSFLRFAGVGRTVRLQVDYTYRQVQIKVDSIWSLEFSFRDMHDFVVITQENPKSMDEDAMTSLFFTLKHPPRIVQHEEGDDKRSDGMRVTHFSGHDPKLFAQCLVYKLDIPNPRVQTERTAFKPMLAKLLDMFTAGRKEVYFAKVDIDMHSAELPEIESGMPTACRHHGVKEVNYAWCCVATSMAFVGHKFGQDFFTELNSVNAELAVNMLYSLHTVLEKNMFADPTNWIRRIRANRLATPINVENLETHAVLKRIAITPTKLVFFPPDIMQTNRVLREFNAENFLRVNIRDEDLEGLCSLYGDLTQATQRVGDVMRRGIKVRNTLYTYLGCSNSQMRNHSCWFVEEDGTNKAELIRSDMGELSEIKNVASYVSRMGQGFSTSKKSVEIPDYEIAADVQNAKYNFTDGIGMISLEKAEEISESICLMRPPCAFQIRLGGCKGVVAVDPNIRMKFPSDMDVDVVVRHSMYKYQSSHKTIEILEYSRPSPLYLNQQIIMLLSNMHVGDDVFMDMLREHIRQLSDMFIHEEAARASSRSIASFVDWRSIEACNIQITTEPFLRGTLLAYYRLRMKDLIEKSKVPVSRSEARVLLGVVDETRTLEYGQVFIQIAKSLDDITSRTILRQKVVISKNPCLHPGDIRTFQAVDVPALHHMVDVVVFPSKGERPHPNELSGSDLDGDKYHCIWCPKLLPPLPNKEPMDYTPAEKRECDHEIGVLDMINHICEYIESDTLGMIDNTHLALADQLGLESEECLELAKKHAYAVDAPKTGNWQHVEKEIKDKLIRYPDFMQKPDKPSYPSDKILGKMFRECRKYVDVCGSYGASKIGGVNYDSMFYYDGSEAFGEVACDVRKEFNTRIMSIMSMYGIPTEAEVMSGCICTVHDKLRNEQSDVAENVSKMRRLVVAEFQKKFERSVDDALRAGGNREVVEMMMASAWYFASYVQDDEKVEHYVVDGRDVRFLAFPWIVSRVLAKVYQHSRETVKEPPRTVHCSISQSVEDLFMESKRNFGELMEVQGNLVQEIQGHLRGAGVVFVSGLSALFLLDKSPSDITMMLTKRPNRHVEPRDQAVLLDKAKDKLWKRSLQCRVVKDRMLVKLKKHNLSKWKVELSVDPSAMLKWLVLKEYMKQNSWLLPNVHVLVRWIRNTGLIGGVHGFLPDYLVPFLFLNFALHYCGHGISAAPSTIHNAHREFEAFMRGGPDPLQHSRIFAELIRPLDGEVTKITNRAHAALLMFFCQPKEKLEMEFHPHLAGILTATRVSELVSGRKLALLEEEMDRAYHKVALHLDVSSLLTRIATEKVFFVEMEVARTVIASEEQFAHFLRSKSGAFVEVHPKTDSRNPGMIVKASGSGAELYVLEKCVQNLNSRFKAEKESSKLSIKGAESVEGCHSLLLEDSVSNETAPIALEPYVGRRHQHHDLRPLYVIRHKGQPSGEAVGHLGTLYSQFQEHFKRQVRSLKRYYSKQLYGEIDLEIKFGRTYVVAPPKAYVEDAQDLTVAHLLGALERRKSRTAKPIWQEDSYRSALTGRAAHYAAKKRESGGEISSSFITHNNRTSFDAVMAWLEARGVAFDGRRVDRGVKVVLAQQNGPKQTAVYSEVVGQNGQPEFLFQYLEQPPIRWVCSDVKRRYFSQTDDSEGSECDVRFMLKTQGVPDSSQSSNSVITKALELHGAVWFENGAIQIRENVMQNVDHCRHYERYFGARTKSFDASSDATVDHLLDRATVVDTLYTNYARVGKTWHHVGGARHVFQSMEKLREVRVVPVAETLFDAKGIDQLLEDMWKLGFEMSNRIVMPRESVGTYR